MNITFHTRVSWLPPTPLGLLPGRWHLEHCCAACRNVVATDDLIDHAQAHTATEPAAPPPPVLDR
ncbi:MAG: hypothetical protein ACT4PW_12815 [Acidimicrobiia bacterium]